MVVIFKWNNTNKAVARKKWKRKILLFFTIVLEQQQTRKVVKFTMSPFCQYLTTSFVTDKIEAKFTQANTMTEN